jgi:hypothetical protein
MMMTKNQTNERCASAHSEILKLRFISQRSH